MGEEKIKYDELSENIKIFLKKREIFDQKTLDVFLYPSVKDLKIGNDADEIVSLLNDYIREGKKIMIWGDEDVDGITSTLILLYGLKNANANVDFYIPKRNKEGYGLNKDGIKEIKDNGYSLIITVDCGISNIEEVDYAKEIGLEVIITDHHEPKEIVPKTYIVNPKLTDIGYRYLAGAGVALKFYLTYLNRVLKISPRDVIEIMPEIFLYAMTGTISDRVPRLDENRIIVVEGEKLLKNTDIIPFNVLPKEDIETSIRPLLSGREELTLKFLTTKSKDEALNIYNALKEKSLNYQSKLEKIFNEAKIEFMKGNYAVFIENYPVEFLGSTANLGKELTGMPVFVLTKNNDEIVGEGRGPDDFNLLTVFEKTKDYLSSYGGHKPACGFRMKKIEYLPYFLSIANNILKEYKPKLQYDAEIKIEEMNRNLLKLISLMKPFGKGNEKPLFLIKKVFVKKEGFKNIIENIDIELKWETAIPKDGYYNILVEGDGENFYVKRWELPDQY
uniref:Single-stranded-DNA-specific exonuclease RecJ n=1 Tax=candidate division WOR-3 bacterium TaxID=2052148 RepID=A0A7C4YBM2_UNCW3